MMEAENAKNQNAVQILKANTERQGQATDMAMKSIDMAHRHTKERLETVHKMIKPGISKPELPEI